MYRFHREFVLGSGRRIGEGRPCFIVAELSGNHNGRLDRALALVDAARDAGADAVKLQTYTADTLTIDCNLPPFRIEGDNAWKGMRLYDLYKQAATPWEWHEPLFDRARKHGLEVFSTPFDATAVDFLEELGAPLYKIASFEMVDHELVRRIGRTGKPVIMSTGMASGEEIGEAVAAFAKTGNRDLVLLKCTSAYPAPLSGMNLRAMTRLAEQFGAPVGLSDHCLSDRAAVAAVARGACVIEKHLTLDRAEGGVDATFSLDPGEFGSMVKALREIEAALGTGELGPGVEEEGSVSFRRSIFAVKDIAAGEVLTRENIRVIRPGHGLAPKHLPEILGRKARVAIARGTPISIELLG